MASPDPYTDASYLFGPIIGAHDIDSILYELVHMWQVSYLREVARRAGEPTDQLKPFRSWRVSSELEIMPEDQTPALIIVNEGLVDAPLKRGTLRPGKSYYAVYRYQLGCLVTAKGKKVNSVPRANRLAKMYALATRLILVQKRDDKSVLGMIDWMDEGPGPLDAEDDRTIAMWTTTFNVEVPNATSWATGPQEPDALPVGDDDIPILGEVLTTDVDVIKEG